MLMKNVKKSGEEVKPGQNEKSVMRVIWWFPWPFITFVAVATFFIPLTVMILEKTNVLPFADSARGVYKVIEYLLFLGWVLFGVVYILLKRKRKRVGLEIELEE